MAKGRKTGGRQKGTPNRVTQELRARILASGLSPIDYMISVMRDTNAPRDIRLDAAKAAAPYVHQRLEAVQVTGPDDGPLEFVVRKLYSPAEDADRAAE